MPQTRISSNSTDPGLNHFIVGPDPYLVEAAKNRLVKIIRERAQGEVSFLKFDVEEQTPDELLAIAGTLPLFARWQIIHVKGALKLRENQAKRMGEYLENPSASTFLIFTSGAVDKEDRKRKIFQILAAKTRLMEVMAWRETEMRAKVRDRLKRSDFHISEEALDFLLETVGSDLGRISHEIEKLTLLVGEERKITLNHVMEMLGFSRQHSVFEFIDALAGKDKVKSLHLANELMSDSSQALQVIALMHRPIRQLIQMKELSGQMSSGEISREIGMYGVPHSVVERRLKQSGQFSYEALVRAVRQLGMLDDRIKRSSIDTKVFAEQLIHELTG